MTHSPYTYEEHKAMAQSLYDLRRFILEKTEGPQVSDSDPMLTQVIKYMGYDADVTAPLVHQAFGPALALQDEMSLFYRSLTKTIVFIKTSSPLQHR